MQLSTTNPLRRLFMLSASALALRAPDGVEGGDGAGAPAEGAGDGLDTSFLGGDGGEGDAAGTGDEGGKEGEGEGDKEPTDEEKAATEAREAAIARLAIPTPESYTVKAPEGFDALDEEGLAAATPLLQKMGVKTNEEAQEVIDLFASDIAPKMLSRAAEQTQAQVQQAVNDVKKGWADATRADPDVGGANFKSNMALAAKAVDKFGGPELRQVFDETGIGFHPALVKAFVNIGRQLAESDFHLPDASAQEKTSMADRMYGDRYKQQT